MEAEESPKVNTKTSQKRKFQDAKGSSGDPNKIRKGPKAHSRADPNNGLRIKRKRDKGSSGSGVKKFHYFGLTGRAQIGVGLRKKTAEGEDSFARRLVESSPKSPEGNQKGELPEGRR